jgi:uncharacterized phage-associated protein
MARRVLAEIGQLHMRNRPLPISAIFVLISFMVERILRCCVKSTAGTAEGCEYAPARPESRKSGRLMFVSRDREKLINAIIYFLRETNHCHTLKLFKLLNFADFEHFRQTGRTIFGLEYHALPKGPVPISLWNEIKRGGDQDLKNAISLFEVKDDITDELLRRDLKPKAQFDKKYFTKREIKIMDRVAEFFKELRAEDMSEFSHMKHLPWAKIYNKGKGKNELIPEDLSLESEPLVHDVPTIDRKEMEFRRELLRDSA